MKKEILISSTINEIRIAITEDGKLAEYFVELADKEKFVGNIYLGKVTRILPSLNAAFINIGLPQNAFLHFSDVDERFRQISFEDDEKSLSNEDSNHTFNFEHVDTSVIDEIDNLILSLNDNAINKAKKQKKIRNDKTNFNIGIKENQLIPVQVVREAFSTKGVKVSTRISIPGRYLVLVPNFTIIGVSRKITSLQERKRLRSIIKEFINNQHGCIIRTAANGREKEELENDWEKLVETWNKIEKKAQSHNEPVLLYKDIELTASIIRDLFRNDISKVIVDSKRLYKEIYEYLEENSRQFLPRLELYRGRISLFDYYQLEKEIEQTYKRKVNLPSGGSIIIDQTEAMFIIDVNSGKFVYETTQEENAFKTNLEAVEEIARQIRLRDISGMIIIDFIDMHEPLHRKKIFISMRKTLRKDRAKTVVFPLTQLSLMQITRQRINLNIGEKVTEICPLCKGLGRIPTKSEVFTKIERWLRNFKAQSKEFRLNLYVHPHIAEYLSEGKISKKTKLMLKYFVNIKLIPDESLPLDKFRFKSLKQNRDITHEFISIPNEN